MLTMQMLTLKLNIERNITEKEKAEQEMQKIQKEILELDEEIKSLNEEITIFTIENKENQTYIDNLNTDIMDLKISVNSFDESKIHIRFTTLIAIFIECSLFFSFGK